MTNWPDPARPGVPLSPDQDGWHWLHHPEDLRPIPAMWNAELQGWTCGSLHSPGGIVELGYRYLGSCLTPADLAERDERMREEGRREEREACAQEADCGCAARADVLARLATDGEKRASYLCVHGDVCCALQAATLRARSEKNHG